LCEKIYRPLVTRLMQHNIIKRKIRNVIFNCPETVQQINSDEDKCKEWKMPGMENARKYRCCSAAAMES